MYVHNTTALLAYGHSRAVSMFPNAILCTADPAVSLGVVSTAMMYVHFMWALLRMASRYLNARAARVASTASAASAAGRGGSPARRDQDGAVVHYGNRSVASAKLPAMTFTQDGVLLPFQLVYVK